MLQWHKVCIIITVVIMHAVVTSSGTCSLIDECGPDLMKDFQVESTPTVSCRKDLGELT